MRQSIFAAAVLLLVATSCSTSDEPLLEARTTTTTTVVPTTIAPTTSTTVSLIEETLAVDCDTFDAWEFAASWDSQAANSLALANIFEISPELIVDGRTIPEATALYDYADLVTEQSEHLEDSNPGLSTKLETHAEATIDAADQLFNGTSIDDGKLTKRWLWHIADQAHQLIDAVTPCLDAFDTPPVGDSWPTEDIWNDDDSYDDDWYDDDEYDLTFEGTAEVTITPFFDDYWLNDIDDDWLNDFEDSSDCYWGFTGVQIADSFDVMSFQAVTAADLIYNDHNAITSPDIESLSTELSFYEVGVVTLGEKLVYKNIDLDIAEQLFDHADMVTQALDALSDWDVEAADTFLLGVANEAVALADIFAECNGPAPS